MSTAFLERVRDAVWRRAFTLPTFRNAHNVRDDILTAQSRPEVSAWNPQTTVVILLPAALNISLLCKQLIVAMAPFLLVDLRWLISIPSAFSFQTVILKMSVSLIR